MKNLFFSVFFIIPIYFNAQTGNVVSLYNTLNDTTLSRDALEKALQFIDKVKPSIDSIVTIIDFTKPSTEKRFFVINLSTKEILIKTYVAHGINSGENYAVKFSNAEGSKMSSAGFYITGKTYLGKHGYSLKLKGLEQGINNNAYKRAIVIHGAWYVSEDFIRANGRLGRSFGCPALDENISKTVIDFIKNGTILYIYTNDEKYWELSNYK